LPAPYGAGLTQMQLLVFTAIALGAMVAAYGFGLGGTVAFLIFLAILLVGVFLRAAQPLLEHLKP
jgi:hypothetical protein